MSKSKVYFSKTIDSEKLVKLYQKLNLELGDKTAIKVHSGEPGNQNFISPDFWAPLIKQINGTIVECNTAYSGKRDVTESHQKVLKNHGWDQFNTDIMDSEGEFEIEIPNGKVLNKNYLGNHIKNYNSMLVLSHFKGHPMGGFGGALKQLSIGCASRNGKAWIHSGGRSTTPETMWGLTRGKGAQDLFLHAMAEAASSVVNLFNEKIAFINVMKNMSVDCDCCAVAEDPCLDDIGILSSLDPVAIDQACIDLVKNSTDPGKVHFMERVTSRNGEKILEYANELGFGTTDYELIEL